jgi:hypothetical protein
LVHVLPGFRYGVNLVRGGLPSLGDFFSITTHFNLRAFRDEINNVILSG